MQKKLLLALPPLFLLVLIAPTGATAIGAGDDAEPAVQRAEENPVSPSRRIERGA